MSQVESTRVPTAGGPTQRIYRAVKAAGAEGISKLELRQQLKDIPSTNFAAMLGHCLKAGFIRRSDTFSEPRYIVDQLCPRVPKGEGEAVAATPSDDALEEAAADEAAREVAPQSTLGIELQSAWLTGRPLRSKDVGAAEDPAPTSPIDMSSPAAVLRSVRAASRSFDLDHAAPAPKPSLVTSTEPAEPAPFKASLSSDNTLALRGCKGQLELTAEETRKLFAWLERLSGVELASAFVDDEAAP